LVILSPSQRPIVVQVIPFDGAGREGCSSAYVLLDDSA
jgi:hypothetical protein